MWQIHGNPRETAEATGTNSEKAELTKFFALAFLVFLAFTLYGILHYAVYNQLDALAIVGFGALGFLVTEQVAKAWKRGELEENFD